MGFQGADTEQLRTHRELLRTRAQSLSELRQTLETARAQQVEDASVVSKLDTNLL